MNNFIKKIASFYDLSQIKPTYQIEYTLHVASCLLINILGLVFLLTPFYYLSIWLKPLSVSDLSIFYLNYLLTLSIFCFFWLGLGSGFFLHNQKKFSLKLQILAFSCFGIGLSIILLQIIHTFILANFSMIKDISQHKHIVYLDLVVILMIIIGVLVTNKKVNQIFKNFLNKNLSKYQE